jgi:hypothetical protein
MNVVTERNQTDASAEIPGAPRHEIELDLARCETEPGWQRLIDQAALAVVPKWFEWLGWVAALAAIRYLASKTQSALLDWLAACSTLLIWYYFNAVFFRFVIRGLPGKLARYQRIISLLFSGAAAYLVWLLASRAADIIAASTK